MKNWVTGLICSLESVQLAADAFRDVGGEGLAVTLVIVEEEVLDARRDVVALDTHDLPRHECGRQERVLCQQQSQAITSNTYGPHITSNWSRVACVFTSVRLEHTPRPRHTLRITKSKEQGASIEVNLTAGKQQGARSKFYRQVDVRPQHDVCPLQPLLCAHRCAPLFH